MTQLKLSNCGLNKERHKQRESLLLSNQGRLPEGGSGSMRRLLSVKPKHEDKVVDKAHVPVRRKQDGGSSLR